MLTFIETRLFTRIVGNYLAKNEAQNIPANVLRRIKEEIDA
jgi:hypothetical protein